MTPEIMSTWDLPARHQLDAWRSWYASVFDLVHQPKAGEEGFLAESRHWTLDGFAVGQVRAPSLCAVRSRALVRRNPVDHWVITLGQHDTSLSTSDDAMAVPAQTPFLISLGRDVVSERVADERLHFYLPRDHFGAFATQLDAARGLVLKTGLGRLLGDFLRNLARTLPDLRPEDLPHVAEAVRAMVGACIVPTPERMTLATGQINAVRLDRIRRAIRKHMGSPNLDASLLCGEIGVSRTQLYSLLQGEGGVQHYIRRRRLEACHAMLSDRSNSVPISGIALRMGFDDPSQFSRVFRQEFGMTPRDVRAAAEAGLTQAPAGDRRGPAVRPLSECLRGLSHAEDRASA